MKGNKFKTLKLFIVFLFIVLILVSVLRYVTKQLEKKASDDIVTNMLIIQGKVKIINGEIRVNGAEDAYIGTKLSDIDNEELKEKVRAIGIEEDLYEEHYLLNIENFNTMEIYGELKTVDNDEYIVNYNHEDVIYIDGIDVNGEIKYKLSDMIEFNKEEVEEEVVVVVEEQLEEEEDTPKNWILYDKIQF